VLAQAVPAADHLHGVVQLEFIAAVGDPLVQHLTDVQLIDGDHQHLVVGQQVAPTASSKRSRWKTGPKVATSSIENTCTFDSSALLLLASA
jgi:hypothetical protein